MHNALPSTPASPNRHVHLYTPIHGYACSHVNSDPGCKGYQGHVTNWASDDKTYPYHQHEHVSHVTKKKDYQKAERKTFISLFLKDLVYTCLFVKSFFFILVIPHSPNFTHTYKNRRTRLNGNLLISNPLTLIQGSVIA